MADTWVQQADVNSASTGAGAVTLAQAALLEKDVLTRGFIETFIENNPIYTRLPFEGMVGNSEMYDYETQLPSLGFRAVNEGYDKSHARFGQRTVGLAIFGGDLDVDKFIVKTRSSVNNQRAIQEAAQIKALSLTWHRFLFDGNRSTSGNEEFDGINVLLADTYHTASGIAKRNMSRAPVLGGSTATAGWHASGTNSKPYDLVSALDDAIDDVIGGDGSKVIVGNKSFRRWLSLLCANNGQITISRDDWGYRLTNYRDIPILEMDEDEAGNQILGFDETLSDADCCSFYVMRMGEGYFQGYSNGGIQVTDLGELDELPVYRTRVEWYTSLAIKHARAVCRVKGMHGY